MRNFIRSLGVVALALAGFAANAEASDLVRVTVPFSFRAGGQVLPAGEFRISIDQRSSLVTISGKDVLTTILLAAPGNSPHDQRSFLRFERYGDEWLLHEISFAGTAQQVGLGKGLKK